MKRRPTRPNLDLDCFGTWKHCQNWSHEEPKWT